jgi:nicotinamide riboside kinase
MRKNEELIENLKKELGKDEITDDDLRIQAFKEAKIEFNNNLVEILEDYYEQVRKIIVGDTTPEGLEMMQKTPTGKRYADLINNSMKLLDNSLTSLGNVAKSNV